MSRHTGLGAAATLLVLAAACADVGTGNTTTNALLLNAAFQSVPAGFSATSNSFDGSGDHGLPFFPDSMVGDDSLGHQHGEPGDSMGMGGHHGDHSGDGDFGGHHDGFGHGGLLGLLMGGGLGPDFIGGIPFGGGEHGPFGALRIPQDCTFDAASGRIACPDRDHDGLTLSLSFALKDTTGAAQSQVDSATDYVNVQTSVSGTKVDDDPDDNAQDDDNVQSTLSHTSDRTITGLAAGSSARTINGTSVGHESVTGVRDSVSFTATRDVSDTTEDLVIPVADGHPTIPSGGTVIRNMSVSITPAGDTTATHTRREQITFDGTNVVQVIITQDGTTKNCTITLPRRQLSCE